MRCQELILQSGRYSKKMKVLAVTGSSGGHIFPALAFLEALKEKHKNIDALLLLPEKRAIKNIKNPGYEVKYVSMPSLELRVSLTNITNTGKVIEGFLKSVFIVLKFQPDVIIGFGSLLTVGVVLCGWLLRIKTFIHEQNAVPGRANRLLAKFADKIAVSFDETIGYLQKHKNKTIVSGNPLRNSLCRIDKSKALDFFGFGADKFTILVMGGSLGSHKINMEFFKAVSLLKNKSVLQIIHLSGTSDYETLYESYRKTGINFSLFGFFDRIEFAYSASDIVIARAGATTIAEIINFSLPAILIPYPYAYRHQYRNAKVLEDKGCAVVFEEEKLSAQLLAEKLEDFVSNKEKLETLRAGYRNIKGPLGAGSILVNEIMR